jgi:GTP-binding protein LepA
LNKVDLPSANPEEVSDDIIDLLGCKLEDIIHAGKTGFGVEYIGRHHEKIPPPSGEVDEPLQALIFDSHYNPFRGIEVIFRVKTDKSKSQKIKFMATGNEYF